MKRKTKISPAQIIVIGFLAIILIGALLLCLPFASRGEPVHFVDALFTATSATCVTGLVSLTTATQWTLFGQIVIIILIQIGGLGFMTFISLSTVIAKKNVSLHQRKLLMQSAGTIELNGIIKHMRRIIFGTFAIEAVGALILSIRFWTSGYGFIKGLWFGAFHSISAFCNAGFDILGESSLIDYQGDYIVLLTVSLLIIIGGIGFLVWDDFTEHKFKLKRYKLHSKIALSTTLILLLAGTIIIYVTERNYALSELNEGQKWLNAFFESVTLRTAGFASFDQAELSTGGTMLSYILMLVGGSPGSTAGGIKTSRIVIAFKGLYINIRKLINPRYVPKAKFEGKSLEEKTTNDVFSFITLYFFIIIGVTFILSFDSSVGEGHGFFSNFSSALACISNIGPGFEAVGPYLSFSSYNWLSKIVLTFTMLIGRLEILPILILFSPRTWKKR